MIDGKSFSVEIRDGLSGYFQDLIHGPGYLSSEFWGTCQDLGGLLFGTISIGIDACFDADDGTGTVDTGSVDVGSTTHTFTWSVDSEGGLLININIGGNVRDVIIYYNEELKIDAKWADVASILQSRLRAVFPEYEEAIKREFFRN